MVIYTYIYGNNTCLYHRSQREKKSVKGLTRRSGPACVRCIEASFRLGMLEQSDGHF